LRQRVKEDLRIAHNIINIVSGYDGPKKPAKKTPNGFLVLYIIVCDVSRLRRQMIILLHHLYTYNNI